MAKGALILGLIAVLVTSWLLFFDGSEEPLVGPGEAAPNREDQGPAVPNPLTGERTAVGQKGQQAGEEGAAKSSLSYEVAVHSPGFGPIADAEVLLVQADPSRGLTERTVAAGCALFTLPSKWQGLPLTVQIAHPDYLVWRGKGAADQPYISVGLIRAARITGRVSGPDGKPIQGAKIQADLAANRMPPGAKGGRNLATLAAASDAAGRFTLDRVPPVGNLTLWCTLPGEGRRESRKATASARAGEESRVDFTIGASGPALEGVLLDAYENGLPGWRLHVEKQGGEMLIDVETGAGGSFTLRLPSTGRVVLFATDPKAAGKTYVSLGAHTVPAEGLVDLRLKIGGVSISGRVDLASGQALPADTGVTAYRESGNEMQVKALTSQLGERGAFTLTGLPEGSYRLAVKAPGYPDHLSWIGKLTTGNHQVDTITLTLQGSGELLIACRGEAGPPPREFLLWRREGDSLIPLGHRSKEKGQRMTEPIPAGEWKIRVEAEGFVPTEIPIRIQAGRASKLTLTFVKGHPVTLAVTTSTGQAPKALYGRTGPGGTDWIAKPAGQGLWSFPALPPGTHTLHVAAPGFLPTRVRVTVPPPASPAATIHLRARSTR